MPDCNRIKVRDYNRWAVAATRLDLMTIKHTDHLILPTLQLIFLKVYTLLYSIVPAKRSKNHAHY